MFRECQKWRREHPDPPWICYFCGKKILIKGRTSESLACHHPDESSLVVPTHYRCHNLNHKHSGYNHPVSMKTKRAVSEANKRRVGMKYKKRKNVK